MPNGIDIITRVEHAFRAGDQATIDELCDPGLVDHNPAPDHEPTLTGFKQKVAGFNSIFPDLEEDLQDIIASGETAATRWVVTGSSAAGVHGNPRHRLDGQGRGDEVLPPQGRSRNRRPDEVRRRGHDAATRRHARLTIGSTPRNCSRQTARARFSTAQKEAGA